MIDTVLKNQRTTRSDEALAYFYCKRDETGSTDPDSVLQAIVKQLSYLRPDLPLRQEVIDVYKARQQSGFSSGPLAFQESVDLIVALINGYPQTAIIIDALDECNPKKRSRFLQALQRIIDRSCGLVKIFVSSRDDTDIVLNLESVPNLSVLAKDNKEDIEKFVREEISKSIAEKRFLRGNVSNELKDRVIQTLANGSHGMYDLLGAFSVQHSALLTLS